MSVLHKRECQLRARFNLSCGRIKIVPYGVISTISGGRNLQKFES